MTGKVSYVNAVALIEISSHLFGDFIIILFYYPQIQLINIPYPEALTGWV